MASKKEAVQKAHSHIGASSAKRWMNCPGSVALCAKLPASKPSFYSAEGSVAHELIERRLKNIVSGALPFRATEEADSFKAVSESTPSMVEKDGFRIPITPEMVTANYVYINEILGRLQEYGLDYSSLYVEQKFHMPQIHKDAYGTNDACIVIPFKKLVILDFKYGAGIPVDVEENPQLLYYALGAYRTLDLDVEEVELVVIQPRTPLRDPVQSWTIPIDRLMEFEKELLDAVKATEAKDAPVVAGEWCQFCPARKPGKDLKGHDYRGCPTREKMAMEALPVTFSTVEEIPTKKLPSPRDLNPLDLSRILKATPILQSWLDDVYDYALEEAAIGRAPEGFVLDQSYGNREWLDDSKAEGQLMALFGDEAHKQSAPKLLSPAQAEDLLKKRKLSGVLPETERPEGNKKLVPIEKAKNPINPKNQFSVI